MFTCYIICNYIYIYMHIHMIYVYMYILLMHGLRPAARAKCGPPARGLPSREAPSEGVSQRCFLLFVSPR